MNEQMMVVEISKLQLKHGDTLVLKVDRYVSQEAATRLEEVLKRIAPEGVKTAILEKDMSLEIVRAA